MKFAASVITAALLWSLHAAALPGKSDALANNPADGANDLDAPLATSPCTIFASTTAPVVSVSSEDIDRNGNGSSGVPQDNDPLSNLLGMTSLLNSRRRAHKPVVLGREFRRRSFTGITKTAAKRPGERRAGPSRTVSSSTRVVRARNAMETDFDAHPFDWSALDSVLSVITQPVVNETQGFVIEGGSNNGDIIIVEEEHQDRDDSQSSTFHTILNVTVS